jgi:hypothetical protein
VRPEVFSAHVAKLSAQPRPPQTETTKAWLETLARRAVWEPAEPLDLPENPLHRLD